ncbi:MAG: hypothetical protein IPK58_14430 [Acidobacteria bacterium]|nr:hypothetical protein [Acidobacteriota bacterium]
MIQCPKCGQVNDSVSNFCRFCGLHFCCSAAESAGFSATTELRGVAAPTVLLENGRVYD